MKKPLNPLWGSYPGGMRHGKMACNGRVVGSGGATCAAVDAQFHGRTAAQERPPVLERNSVRPQDRHPVGGLSAGDGLLRHDAVEPAGGVAVEQDEQQSYKHAHFSVIRHPESLLSPWDELPKPGYPLALPANTDNHLQQNVLCILPVYPLDSAERHRATVHCGALLSDSGVRRPPRQ